MPAALTGPWQVWSGPPSSFDCGKEPDVLRMCSPMSVRQTFEERFQTELVELFSLRRDVRHFKRDPLPPDEIEKLVELTRLSPSVGYSQPWRFVKVDDEQRR